MTDCAFENNARVFATFEGYFVTNKELLKCSCQNYNISMHGAYRIRLNKQVENCTKSKASTLAESCCCVAWTLARHTPLARHIYKIK